MPNEIEGDGVPLTWDELEKDTYTRNVRYLEVEDQLLVLENMVKKDISVACYQHAYASIEGFMLEVKGTVSQPILHGAAIRK